MGSSFRRKSYGKVKPVPKPKQKAPSKPAVVELKKLYVQLQKSSDVDALDLIAKALLWWNTAFAFTSYKFKKGQSLASAKAFLAAEDYLRKGHLAKDNKEKMRCFIEVLNNYQRFAAPLFSVPVVAPYLKKSKEVTKKRNAINKKVAVRFDSILTLLGQCFNSSTLSFIPVVDLPGALSRKVDHALGKMYFSRKHCTAMKSLLYKKGLLALVLQEAPHIARAMAFNTANGRFVADAFQEYVSYKSLLDDFEQFAHTTACPGRLVKRDKKVAKKKVTTPEVPF